MGFYDPQAGVIPAPPDGPLVLVSFYRSYLTAADTAPVDALIHGLRDAGFAACGVFAPSLKAPGFADWLTGAKIAPQAIVNATGFSVRSDGAATPFDTFGCPVFQVALSTNRRREWAGAERGLSPADLAMHVVLPEVDGRIFAGVISFKAPEPRDPDLQYSRFAHRPDPDRIAATVARVGAWLRLGRTPPQDRQVALILSTYPGRDWQMAHAVGLDALASADAVAGMLADQGHDIAPGAASDLRTARIRWPLAEYLAALDHLPQTLKGDLTAAWGVPDSDPDCDGKSFQFAAIRRGKLLLALQPERSQRASRDDDYHDLTRVPRHAYVAFYLWLHRQGLHTLIHMGAHGTLEWLPGKAVALSGDCWPEALTGPLPVIYPFIVNDPGEAAQAKRRLGAVTLGHMPPPMIASRLPEAMSGLERLLDEYSTADGLDPARRDRLIASIRDEARAAGVEDDLGIPPTPAPPRRSPASTASSATSRKASSARGCMSSAPVPAARMSARAC